MIYMKSSFRRDHWCKILSIAEAPYTGKRYSWKTAVRVVAELLSECEGLQSLTLDGIELIRPETFSFSSLSGMFILSQVFLFALKVVLVAIDLDSLTLLNTTQGFNYLPAAPSPLRVTMKPQEITLSNNNFLLIEEQILFGLFPILEPSTRRSLNLQQFKFTINREINTVVFLHRLSHVLPFITHLALPPPLVRFTDATEGVEEIIFEALPKSSTLTSLDIYIPSDPPDGALYLSRILSSVVTHLTQLILHLPRHVSPFHIRPLREHAEKLVLERLAFLEFVGTPEDTEILTMADAAITIQVLEEMGTKISYLER